MASRGTDAERRRLEAVAFARPSTDPIAAEEQRAARQRLDELSTPPETGPAEPPARRRPWPLFVVAALALGAFGGWAVGHTPTGPSAPVTDPLDAVFANTVENWSRIDPTPAQAAIAAQSPVYVNPLPDSDGFQVALALTGSEEVCILVTYPDASVAGSCVTGDEFVTAGISIDSTGKRSTPYPATSTVEGQRLQPAQAALTRVNVTPSGDITESITPLAGGLFGGGRDDPAP
ncbi:hypothetical protein HQQ81_08185 [Microbacteriaceae bacterium VKM Ac-2854]|nr:hypothetical protein [Microbacteriaceae bacterium VKM Ac-2854]